MKRTLYKAILKSRNTPVITLSIAMVGIYVGYLIWYIVNRYLPEPISSYRVLVAILTFWICAFVAIYKIPDQLFTNRRIKDVLCFPVSADELVSLVIGRLACFQFGMVVCGFWAYFLYASDDWLLTITILLCYKNVIGEGFTAAFNDVNNWLIYGNSLLSSKSINSFIPFSNSTIF